MYKVMIYLELYLVRISKVPTSRPYKMTKRNYGNQTLYKCSASLLVASQSPKVQ